MKKRTHILIIVFGIIAGFWCCNEKNKVGGLVFHPPSRTEDPCFWCLKDSTQIRAFECFRPCPCRNYIGDHDGTTVIHDTGNGERIMYGQSCFWVDSNGVAQKPLIFSFSYNCDSLECNKIGSGYTEFEFQLFQDGVMLDSSQFTPIIRRRDDCALFENVCKIDERCKGSISVNLSFTPMFDSDAPIWRRYKDLLLILDMRHYAAKNASGINELKSHHKIPIPLPYCVVEIESVPIDEGQVKSPG